MEEGAGDMAAGPPAAQAQRWAALTVIRTPKSIGTSPRRYHGARTQHPVSQCRSKTWRRPTAQDRTRRPPAPSSWPLPAPSSLLTFQTKERNKLTSIQSKRSSIHPTWMYLNPNEDTRTCGHKQDEDDNKASCRVILAWRPHKFTVYRWIYIYR